MALVGDIAHSRTARSNIWGLKKLGAHVIVCGPSTLVSPRWAETRRGVLLQAWTTFWPGWTCSTCCGSSSSVSIRPTVPFGPRVRAPVRHESSQRLAKTKDDILIIAPGPINRGVEVTPDVADGPHSAILDQVSNGLAVRMAVLWLVSSTQRAATVGAEGR